MRASFACVRLKKNEVGRVGPNCEFAPCPEGFRKEGDVCNPECYYSTPPYLAPSIPCEKIAERMQKPFIDKLFSYVFMDGIVKGLYDIVSDSLHEMTWRCNFPVHPNVGLWSFLEAFREYGVPVDFDGTNATFSLDRTLKERQVVLQASMHKDEIMRGWGWHPLGSPHAFYDSICIVYDRAGQALKENRDEENVWSYIRNGESKDVRAKFEDQVFAFFPKYHENILMPVSGIVPNLDEPKLFHTVLKDFPMDVYRQAMLLRSDTQLTPCAETLLEMDWGEFNDKYHPSTSVLEDYFWGHYLFALMKEKGYKVEYNDEEALKLLVARGWTALKGGYIIFPCKSNSCKTV